jgi:hypothetical protein
VQNVNSWLASQTSFRRLKRLKASELNEIALTLHRLATIQVALDALDRPDADLGETLRILDKALGDDKTQDDDNLDDDNALDGPMAADSESSLQIDA